MECGLYRWRHNAVGARLLRAENQGQENQGQSKNSYLGSITGVGGTPIWTANQRDAYLNLTTQTYGNNIATTDVFDPMTGRITSVRTGPSGSVLKLDYTWDQAGNLKTRTDNQVIPAVAESFGYDQLNRLTGSSISGVGGKSLTYDFIGNIVSKSDVGGTYCYYSPGSPCYSGASPSGPHAVQKISGGTVNSGAGLAGSIASPSYAYDLNGNMTSGAGRTVTYTVTNQTATVTYAGGTITYAYDSSDQRYKQSAPGGTTTYWNAQGVTSEEYVASGSPNTEWRNYVVAGDETIGIIKGNTAGTTKWGSPTKWGDCCWSAVTFTALYFHDDHLGSVAAITDSAGTVQEHDYYDAWGKRRNANGTDDTSDTIGNSIANRGYTTQEQVNEIAWLNLNARMYDPQIGKFMSPDPKVAQPYTTQGWNRYAYVGNNPLARTDPTGMSWVSDLFDAIGDFFGSLFGGGGGTSGSSGGTTTVTVYDIYFNGVYQGTVTAAGAQAAGINTQAADEAYFAGNNSPVPVSYSGPQAAADSQEIFLGSPTGAGGAASKSSHCDMPKPCEASMEYPKLPGLYRDGNSLKGTVQLECIGPGANTPGRCGQTIAEVGAINFNGQNGYAIDLKIRERTFFDKIATALFGSSDPVVPVTLEVGTSKTEYGFGGYGKMTIYGNALPTTPAHEFGHVLGLGHDTVDPSSVMYAGYSSRELRTFSPNESEIKTLVTAYPTR